MKHAPALAILLGIVGALPTVHADEAVSLVARPNSLEINIAGQPFAEYVFRDEKIPRPYLAHVRVPGGPQVTRNHPPIDGQDATDHDTLHPGIWLAFGDLSGADFWRNRASVEHVEFVDKPTSDRDGARFAAKNRYRLGDKTICEELAAAALRRVDPLRTDRPGRRISRRARRACDGALGALCRS